MSKAEEILEKVGLLARANHEGRQLSRGDKRRLELAVCLVQHPRLLLLDEPTAGMSQHDTGNTIDLLSELTSAKAITCVIIEHDVKLVFRLSDKITVLQQGTVIADGTPDEIQSDQRVQDAYLGGAKQS